MDEPPGYDLLPLPARPSPVEDKLDRILEKLDDIDRRLDGIENPGISCDLILDLGYTKDGTGARFRTRFPIPLEPPPGLWDRAKD